MHLASLLLCLPALAPAGLRASVLGAPYASIRAGLPPLASLQPAAPPTEPLALPLPLPSATERALSASAAALRGIAPIAALIGLNQITRLLLLATGLAVPSSLFAMLLVFGALCGLSVMAPSTALALGGFFSPGAELLNKWLATFYVPSLLAFPLTAPDLAPLQIAACMGLCVVMLCTNIAVTAGACWLLGRSSSQPGAKRAGAALDQSSPSKDSTTADDEQLPVGARASANAPSSPKPRTLAPDVRLALGAVAFGLLAAFTSNRGFGLGHVAAGSAFARLTRLAVDGCLTASIFSGLCAGDRVHPKLRTALHPIFVSTGAATAAVIALAVAGVGTPRQILRAFLYEPVLRAAGGAPLVGGGALTALLAPTVVSFGLQMHSYRDLMAARAKQVFGSLAIGTTFGLGSSILAGRLLDLAPSLRLAILPRAVTTPLALEMARLLAAEPAIVILAVFTTGLVVITTGPIILNLLRCTDPVTRGLALGASAHGGGVLALSEEKQAFPFAAMAMALNGAASVLLLCIPPVRRLVIKAALG